MSSIKCALVPFYYVYQESWHQNQEQTVFFNDAQGMERSRLFLEALLMSQHELTDFTLAVKQSILKIHLLLDVKLIKEATKRDVSKITDGYLKQTKLQCIGPVWF